MVAAHFARPFENLRSVDGKELQRRLRGALDVGQREEQVLRGNEFVGEGRRLFRRLQKDFLQIGAERRTCAAHAREPRHVGFDRFFEPSDVAVERVKNRQDVPLFLV